MQPSTLKTAGWVLLALGLVIGLISLGGAFLAVMGEKYEQASIYRWTGITSAVLWVAGLVLVLIAAPSPPSGQPRSEGARYTDEKAKPSIVPLFVLLGAAAAVLGLAALSFGSWSLVAAALFGGTLGGMVGAVAQALRRISRRRRLDRSPTSAGGDVPPAEAPRR